MCGKRATESLNDRKVNSGTLCSAVQNSKLSNFSNVQPVLDFIFAHCDGDDRPYLEVEILGIKITGLLDSGATRSFLNLKAFQMLKDIGVRMEASSISTCTVANQSTLTISGAIDVPIKLENEVAILELLVVPQLSHDLVLGIDFWKTMNLIPNLRSKCWTFSSTPPVIKDNIGSITAHENLSDHQRQQMSEVMNKFQKLMEDRLGCTDLVEHKIEVTVNEPIKQRSYRVSPAMQHKIDDEVSKMLEMDVIELSNSAWSSPALMVPKKDGSFRFCIDFRQLNRSWFQF